MEDKFETAISGISGRFPDCESIPEFKEKLYSGKSFMSLVPERWPVNFRYQYTDLTIPPATGKFKYIKEFDPAVFKMSYSTAECADVINRKILEPAFEAVMDSGLNPYDLMGRNIGVYMAFDHSDSDLYMVKNAGTGGRQWVLGSCKSMMSNRISFALDLTGPSFTYSNDMFGNFTALNEAYKSISEGRVEAAIVGICSAVQHPMLAMNLTQMGVLSMDCITRVFDKNANGFGRSDSLVTLFLQRIDDAKRIYALIDFAGYTYFGSNPNSLYNFDEDLLTDSLSDLYATNGYNDTSDVSFVEMSACGVKKYDKTESNFIADNFCKTRKTPLLVGSIKSNIGVTDCVGPYASLIKAIFALQSGVIVQNLNFKEVNGEIKAFTEKKLKVVTTPTPLSSNKIVVNSVGIAGSLSQVILKKDDRVKNSKESFGSDDLPRLVLACSRTENGISEILRKLEQATFNAEFISMVNDVFSKDMPYHIFRGYSILSSDVSKQKKNSSDVKGSKNRPVWFLFSGMGSQWNKMGEGLLQFPIIAEVVKKCDQVLKNVNVDIYHILTTDDPTVFDNIMHSFVGIITIQIALVEVLRALGIKPDGIIGHSVGENACAYADGCLTLEQAVLSSYARGMASLETDTIKGMMAAVGKGYKQIINDLPESIEVACHNSSTSCTLSGPTDDVEKYVQKLQEQKVFAKAVNVANIAYHSKHIAPAAPNLLTRLRKVIPKPMKRSEMWVSTSVPESDWDKPLAQNCSPEYLTNNLLSSVLFEEGSKHIPSNAIVIEIAPHGLLQAIMKRSLPDTCANIALTRRNNDGKNIENLLAAIGQCFICGLDVNVNALYPSIEYPVANHTPSIAPLARWHHIAPDSGLFCFDLVGSRSGDQITIRVNDDSPYSYLRDHKINDRIILPTSFFLVFIWWVYSVNRNEKLGSSPVVFERIHHRKNVSISVTKPLKVSVFIQKGSGHFEILKYKKKVNSKTKNMEIISGVIHHPEEPSNRVVNNKIELENVEYTVSRDQFYNLLNDVGYQMTGMFRCLEELKYNDKRCYANIKWTNNWVSFLDSLLKMSMFFEIKNKSDMLYTSKIEKIYIFPDQISSLNCGTSLLCHKEFNTNIINGPGLKIHLLKNQHILFKNKNTKVTLKGLHFVSHENPRCQDVAEFFKLCLQIAVDNVATALKRNEFDAKLHITAENGTEYFNVLKRVSKSCGRLKTKTLFHEAKQVLCNNYMFMNECCMLLTSNSCDIGNFALDYSFLLIVAFNDEPVSTIIDDNFVQITTQKFGDETFHLFKKKNYVQNRFVQIENDQWSTSPVSKKSTPESTFIIKKNTESDDLSLMLKDCRQPFGSRYLFVLDDEIPRHKTMQNIQMQNLSVAVLLNKEWGSYQYLSENLLTSEKQNESFSLSHTSEEVQLESIDVQYLRSEKGIDSLDNQTHSYGIEYSGIQHSGEKVMGLSLVESCESISKPDSILKWKVPKHWSLEDAATVPFVYSQAYRILDELVIQSKKYVDSILIYMSDDGPFSEACISISLSRKQIVYVVVADSQEAVLIKNKFPQLDYKNIIILQEHSVRFKVNEMTCGQGVDKIVNCSADVKVIEDLLYCVSIFGKFFQVSVTNEWEMHDLGMYPFLNNISFLTLPNRISTLLKLPNNDKHVLKLAIEDGIKTGVVVPFVKNIHIPGMTETSRPTNSAIKTHTRDILKWIPVSNYSCNTNQRILYDDKHSYIIIGGKEKTNSWFELVEWMVMKGARKIIVVLESFVVGPKVSHRINRLVNKKKVTVVVNAIQRIDTLQECKNLVEETNMIGPLEAVFFISVASASKKISNIDLATRQLDSIPHVVCIFSGGLKECELRRYSGFPAIVIHGRKPFPRLSVIFPEVDNILSQFDNANSPTLYHIINAENDVPIATIKNYLPRDISDLENIADDLTSEIKFVEVSTKAPRYETLKDSSPIFVISVLGPRPLRKLFSNLVNPAFCTSIGYSKCSAEESASILYKSLNSVQSKGGVTLLSETWSTPIALELVKLLKQDERKYRLFTLEGNPLVWKDYIRRLGITNSSQFENNLITELFNTLSMGHTESSFGLNKSLQEKVENYLSNCNYSSATILNLTKVLHSIRMGLELISNYKYDNELLENVTSIVKNHSGNRSLNLSVTSESYVHKEEDYFKFICDPRVYNKINDGVLYTLWCD